MESIKARIHSFESMGTVDGPGIRYVVFFQGCPLQCKYCHNRDTWDVNGGEEYTVNDVFKKVLRGKPFMDASNGGVTCSGGEPLLQAKFIKELFKKLKAKGIHTAIDTAGSVAINEDIKELLEYTDLVILDIKHIDDKKCKELTSKSNKNTLDFAKYLSTNNKKMWIRQVLVPGYTDNKDDLKKTREFIDSLNGVEKVEVLPYHDLGKYKWKELGYEYPLEGVKIPTNKEVKEAEDILIK